MTFSAGLEIPQLPTNQPPRPSTRLPISAEKIMEPQQQILRVVRELLTPISSEQAATDPGKTVA